MTTTQLLFQDAPPPSLPLQLRAANQPKFPPIISLAQSRDPVDEHPLPVPHPKSTTGHQGTTHKGTGGCISDGVRQKLLVYLMNKKRPDKRNNNLLRSASSLTCNSTARQGADLECGSSRQPEAKTYQSTSASSYSCNLLIVNNCNGPPAAPGPPEVSSPLKRCYSIKNLQHRAHPYKLHNLPDKPYKVVCDVLEDKMAYSLNRTSSFTEKAFKGRYRQVSSHHTSTTYTSLDGLSMRKTSSESDLKNKCGLHGVSKMSPASGAQDVCPCNMSTYPAHPSSPDQAMDLSIGPAKGDKGKQPNRMRGSVVVSIASNNSYIEESMETDLSLGSMDGNPYKPNSVWQSLPNIPKGIADRRDELNAMDDGEHLGKAKSFKVKHHPYSIDCLVYNGQSWRGHSRNVPPTSPIQVNPVVSVTQFQESMNVTPPPTLCSRDSNPNVAPPSPLFLPQSSNVYLGPSLNYLPAAAATAYMMYCHALGQPYPFLPHLQNLPQQLRIQTGLPSFPQPPLSSFYPTGPLPPFEPPLHPNWFSAAYEAMKHGEGLPSSSLPKQSHTGQNLCVDPPSPQNKRWSEAGEAGNNDISMEQDVAACRDEPSIFRNRVASTGGRVPYKPRYHRMFVLKAEAAAAATSFERTNSEPIPGPPNFMPTSPLWPKPQLSFPVVGRSGISSKSRINHRKPISKPLKKCVSEIKLTPSRGSFTTNYPSAQKSTSSVYTYSDEVRDGPDSGGVEDKAGNKQRLKEAILQWVANKSPSTSSISTEKCLVKGASSRVSASSKRLKRSKNIDIPEYQPLSTATLNNNNNCRQNHVPTRGDSNLGFDQDADTKRCPKAPILPNGLSFSQRREDTLENVNQHLLLKKGMAASSFSLENRASRIVSEIEAVNALASLSMTQTR